MSNQKNVPTINEKQFFNIEGKGREAVAEVIEKTKDELWDVRPEFFGNEQKEAYFKKLLINIANDEKLKPLTQSRKGLYTLYQKMAAAMQLGITIGGSERPQSYITAFKKANDFEAALIVTADGYKWVVTNPITGIFKDVIPKDICKNDDYDLDEGSGEMKFKRRIDGPRGDFLGFAVQLIKNDGGKSLTFVSKEMIDHVRDKHSAFYKKFKSGPWVDDYLAMAEKTSIKKALRPYISICQGLANLDKYEEAIQEIKPIEKNISDRMESRLENVTIEPQEVEVIEEKKETIKQEDGDLF